MRVYAQSRGYPAASDGSLGASRHRSCYRALGNAVVALKDKDAFSMDV